MKKKPKLWRRKKGGHAVGNWFVTLKGEPINLGTKDAGQALTSRDDAIRGRRSFVSDVEAAADQLADPEDTRGAVEHVGVHSPEKPGSTPGPATEPASAQRTDADAGSQPAAPEVPTPAVDPADDLNAAAAASSPDAPATPATAGDAGPDAITLPNGMTVTMEDVLKLLGKAPEELAPLAVEGQIELGKLVGKWRNREAREIAPKNIARVALVLGYTPVIRTLQLEDLQIHPMWLILGGTVGLLVSQFWGSKQIEPEAPASGATV